MDFLEPLLIWIASCFPFFMPLIVPVGSYGFYKHAARHTDGTDDIQNATSVQKGLMTAAQAEEVDSISPAQWGYLGELDQSVKKVADAQFGTLKIGTATARGGLTFDTPGYSFCVNSVVNIDDEGSVNLEDYITSILGIVWVIESTGASAIGAFVIRGGSNQSVVAYDPLTTLSATDVDGKLCLLADGDGTYTLKNRLGSARQFLLMHFGI